MGATLNSVLTKWRDRILRDVKVSLPGYITKYDSATRLAEIQLTVKPEINDEFTDPPLLYKVPIRQLNSQAVLYYTPPAARDLVDVVFADYSIDENQQEDGQTIVEPDDTTKHSVSKAYAEHRVETAKNKHTITDPTLPGIYLAPDSKLFLGRLGGGQEELLNLIHQQNKTILDLINYIKTV